MIIMMMPEIILSDGIILGCLPECVCNNFFKINNELTQVSMRSSFMRSLFILLFAQEINLIG